MPPDQPRKSMAFSEACELKNSRTKERFNPMYDAEDEEEAGEGFYQSPESREACCLDDFSRAARMDTIYESFEEFGDSSDERSCNEVTSSSSDGTSSARVSADSPTSVLRRSVRAWCEATGLPTTVLVETKDRSFRLHKFPLVSRSGYFKRMLSTSIHVKLPDIFPGESDVFELVASFCYDSAIHIDPENVALLRCWADYLEMTEEYGRENLCQRTESYLKQAVLKSWTNTMVVLQHCQKLLPVSEELLIITRCLHSLAEAAAGELHRVFISGGSLKEMLVADGRSNVHVKDILQLPFGFFDKLVVALRKQKVEEEMVSQLIMEYTQRHLLDEDQTLKLQSEGKICLLEALVKLLPLERFAMPLRFLFSLHGFALAWGANEECRAQLECSIAFQLELATFEDVLVSLKECDEAGNRGLNIESMQQIASLFMSEQKMILDSSEILLADHELKTASSFSSLGVSAVAKVWDEYLGEIASGPELNPRKFLELSEVIPTHIRVSHDQLYKAIHVYFKAHTSLSQPDRFLVCRGLNCQKLSREVCMHAVQNELMPLRLIVQAMFMHQLQPPRADESANTSVGSASFHRRTLTADCQTFERVAMDQTQPQQQQQQQQDDGLPLGLILQRDAAYREAAFLKDDFEATKNRLRELEQELVRLKKTMQVGADGSNSGGKTRRSKFGGSCMCQMYWRAQASGVGIGQRISKTFQRLGIIGGLTSRSKSGSPSPSPSKSANVWSSANVHAQREKQQGCGTPASRLWSRQQMPSGGNTPARSVTLMNRGQEVEQSPGGLNERILHLQQQVGIGGTPARSNSFRRAGSEGGADGMNKTKHSRHRSFS